MFFAHAGITITSGLALGIDTACHEGALAGGGPTVAVLGCGLDQIYPRENQALADRIAATGAVITEFPPGSSPLPAYFPQRNRIIAGLSHGTLVVEAAQRSGSLITARLAGVAGREVFAIPGSITIRSPGGATSSSGRGRSS
jgi:DNA processing protein